MALDYKMVQTIAASRPPDGDAYCPECGRPWADSPPVRSGEPAAMWRNRFLIVVGVALALAFGSRAASAYHTEAAIQRNVANGTRCLSGVAGAQPCLAYEALAVWLSASDQELDAVRTQRDRALGGTALGLLALAAGLAASVRHRSSATAPRQTRSALPAAGETLLAVTCFQILAAYLDRVAVQVAAGQPLTAQTLDRAADQILGVLALLSGG